MLFSIIIPMYNLENYIQKTLESILQNDLSDCELLLLDDGSTDKTVEMAEALLSKKCLCYYAIIKKENTGVSDTRNQGIKLAKGKYILFCDGDDFFEPDLISTIRVEVENNADMAAWPFFTLQGTEKKLSQKDGESRIYSKGQMMKRHLLEGYKMRLGSFVIKRELLVNNEVYFTRECTFAEDMEFIMKCILEAGTIHWIQRPLFCYVKREGSLVNSYNIRRFEAPRAIERVYQYLQKREIDLEESLKEYMKNGLYVLHYIYSLEGCLLNLHSQKEGRQLYSAIQDNYIDVEMNAKEKLKLMLRRPIGISDNRLKLLRAGTCFYICMRLFVKRIKGS